MLTLTGMSDEYKSSKQIKWGVIHYMYLDRNINYVEKGESLSIQAVTELYESELATSLICKKEYFVL